MYCLNNNTPPDWQSAKLLSASHRLQWIDCPECKRKWGSPFFTDRICIGSGDYYSPTTFYELYGRETFPGSCNYNSAIVKEKKGYRRDEISWVDVAKLYMAEDIFDAIIDLVEGKIQFKPVNNGRSFIVIPKYHRTTQSVKNEKCNNCLWDYPPTKEDKGAGIFFINNTWKTGISDKVFESLNRSGYICKTEKSHVQVENLSP